MLSRPVLFSSSLFLVSWTFAHGLRCAISSSSTSLSVSLISSMPFATSVLAAERGGEAVLLALRLTLLLNLPLSLSLVAGEISMSSAVLPVGLPPMIRGPLPPRLGLRGGSLGAVRFATVTRRALEIFCWVAGWMVWMLWTTGCSMICASSWSSS
jgi:hypothetical protein